MNFGRHKYMAKRTEYDGVSYASKAEAQRAQALDWLQRNGDILAWFRQVKCYLGVPENTYTPDFLVIGVAGQCWFEDVKGMETAAFKRNKRLWKSYGRLVLRIIKNGKVVEEILPEGK